MNDSEDVRRKTEGNELSSRDRLPSAVYRLPA
jgi:hypothetical protein